MFDKISLVEKQNKIQVTDFLSPIEVRLLKDVLSLLQYDKYVIYGGIEEADRNAIVFYPDKLEEVFRQNRFDFNSIFSCIRITDCHEDYEHKIYLGGCIKLGVKREKIGDIVVFENGADIIINKDVEKFLLSNLCQLSRFKNAKIEVIELDEVTDKIQKFKDIKVIVSSLRLDNVVAELVGTSRSKALELLNQERVFINYKNETKPTKAVVEKDIITIRGKGKFIFEGEGGTTKKDKLYINIKMYV